jgi:Protein of unknown function (DUF3147)
MMVHAKLASIKGIQPHEYVVRFFFGGAVCVMAGLIAKWFGPGIGGLFLAFPAVFPAGATLIEAHEKKHKARAGFDGTNRGRTVAGVDAAGTALGCIGLACFAVVFWLTLPKLSTITATALATITWLVVSVGIWLLRKAHFSHRETHKSANSLRGTNPRR